MTSHATALKAAGAGILAGGLLLGVYFSVLTRMSGWEFARHQLAIF